MMDVQELSQAYARVRERHGTLPEMAPGNIDWQTETLATADAVDDRLQALAPVEGWIMFQSENVAFRGGKPLPVADAERGVILAAEGIDTNGTAFQLRQNGGGAWVLTQYHQSEGKAYLCDTVRFVSADPALGDLWYRRYWRFDNQQESRPVVACFVGFGGQDE